MTTATANNLEVAQNYLQAEEIRPCVFYFKCPEGAATVEREQLEDLGALFTEYGISPYAPLTENMCERTYALFYSWANDVVWLGADIDEDDLD